MSMISLMDILIVKRRDRAFVLPKTEAGARWIRSNIDKKNRDPAFVINSEFIEDLVEELKKDNINVGLE